MDALFDEVAEIEREEIERDEEHGKHGPNDGARGPMARTTKPRRGQRPVATLARSSGPAFHLYFK